MFRKITFRLTLAIAMVLGLIIGLSGFLNYSKFMKIFSSLFQSRIEYLISDLKHTVEFSLTLGLPLSDLKNIQDLIDQTKKDDDQIRTITVFDAGGKVIFCTNSDLIGSDVAEPWKTAATGKDAFWTILEEREMVMGTKVLNAIDQVAGFIALGYSREYYDSILDDVNRDVIKVGIIIFGVCLLASVILSVILLKPMTRRFTRIDRSLRSLLDPGIQSVPEDEMTSPMERQFLIVRKDIKDTLGEMERLTTSIEQVTRRTAADPRDGEGDERHG